MVLGWAFFGDWFLPGRPVDIATVVTQRSTTESQGAPVTHSPAADSWTGEVLFQASGWIEAEPFPTRVTALVGGVVENAHVFAGQPVERGQLLATLVREDFEIARREAEARRLEAQAKAQQESVLVRRFEAMLATNAYRVAAAEARLQELVDEADRFREGGAQAFSRREIEQAKLRVATGRAEVDAIKARERELMSEIEVQKLSAETAQRRVEVAAAAVARAELDLSRTEIRSPIDGVVQQLFVSPGKRRMLHLDEPEAATVATLYDPDRLQARIDVPLDEVAKLFVGQPVVVRSSLLADRRFKGRVSRIGGMADIQRNTLQAKVSLEDADPLLRPDMLCRAEFLSVPPQAVEDGSESGTGGLGRVTVFVPEGALSERTARAAVVWTVSTEAATAERRPVILGTRSRGGYVEVAEGLRPGEPVILHPPSDLKSGERLKPRINDPV